MSSIVIGDTCFQCHRCQRRMQTQLQSGRICVSVHSIFLNSGADSRAGAAVCSSRPSVAQSSALELVQTKVRRMWERFGEISDEKNLPVSASGAVSNFEMDSNIHYPAFDPDAVDLPKKGSSCRINERRARDNSPGNCLS